jgi:hypothetical protein
MMKLTNKKPHETFAEIAADSTLRALTKMLDIMRQEDRIAFAKHVSRAMKDMYFPHEKPVCEKCEKAKCDKALENLLSGKGVSR